MTHLRLLASPWRALTIGSVMLISLIAFEALAITTAMPTVVRALNGLSLYAVAFGATFAASMVGMVLSGQWSDANGPERPLMSGVAWFVAGLLVAGFASSMLGIIVGRAMQGFGAGQLIVALYVVVGRAYPPELRPRVFAAFAGAWVLPSFIGPPAAGLIVQFFGWRWVFLSVAALAVPAGLVTRSTLRKFGSQSTPENHSGDGLTAEALAGRRSRSRRQVLCALGAAICTALLNYASQQHGVYGFVLVAAGFIGVLIFAVYLLPPGALTLRIGLPSVVAMRGIAAGAYVAAEVFVPLMLTTERGMSPTSAGLSLTAGGVLWAVGSWYQGRPTQSLSGASLLRLGMILTGLGIVTTGLVLMPNIPAAIAMIGWGIAGFGMGLVYPTLSVLTLQISRREEQGENSSALQLADAIFSTAALAIAGSLFAALVTRSATAAYLACFAVALALAMVGIAAASRAVHVSPES